MSSSPTVQAVVISTDIDQPVRVENVDVSELGIFRAVGDGEYEVLPVGDENGAIYLNAYGKVKGMPVNARATRLADHFRPGFAAMDRIAGPVIVVGTDLETGDPADVPATVAEVALSWEISPTTAR